MSRPLSDSQSENFIVSLIKKIPMFKKGNLRHNVSVFVAFCALISGVLTLSVLSGFSIFSTNPQLVLCILGIDVVVFLILSVIIARKLIELWAERKRGLAGSKIHVRLTMIFSVLAVVPAIIMTVLSILFFHFGIQDWFSARVKNALAESVSVAQSYLDEHKKMVAKDAHLMAYDVDRQFQSFKNNRSEADQYLTIMAGLRSLSEAIIFDNEQNLLGRSNLTFALQFEPIPIDAIEQAKFGKVVFLSSAHKDRIRALVRLPTTNSVYLFVGRSVDPSVLKHFQKAEAIFDEYGILEGQRLGFEIVVVALFFVIALLLLFVSIWIGLVMAEKIVTPIKALIEASESMRQGNLDVRVPERQQKDELTFLSRSFNRMSARISLQQKELLETNKILEERRRFIESTLSSVSSGVIGLDASEKILYPNEKASELLGVNLLRNKGKKITLFIPELKSILKRANLSRLLFMETQTSVNIKGSVRTFVVHVVVEKIHDEIKGYVLTLDDITNLISAQKQAAWAEVAQRVAHEIKNPLTPIHLSAERLKRKYLDKVDDSKNFSECIDTIIRQVNFIGHLVSEFSAFARLPIPVFSQNNLGLLCQQAIFLYKNNYSSINFSVTLPKYPVLIRCDGQQIIQALSNILKNSTEALLENSSPNSPSITLILSDTKTQISISIKDNGPGFPLGKKDKFLDPYMTTRSQGNGLGLSIVQKIIEDHKGKISLSNDKKNMGATVRLVFPKNHNSDNIDTVKK